MEDNTRKKTTIIKKKKRDWQFMEENKRKIETATHDIKKNRKKNKTITFNSEADRAKRN